MTRFSKPRRPHVYFTWPLRKQGFVVGEAVAIAYIEMFGDTYELDIWMESLDGQHEFQVTDADKAVMQLYCDTDRTTAEDIAEVVAAEKSGRVSADRELARSAAE